MAQPVSPGPAAADPTGDTDEDEEWTDVQPSRKARTAADDEPDAILVEPASVDETAAAAAGAAAC